MSSIERPKLRSVNAFLVKASGRQMIYIQDPLRFAKDPVLVSPDAFFIVSLFDGNHSILDIQEQYARRYGEILFSDRVRDIIQKLDSSLLLESERFQEHRRLISEEFSASSVRAAFHAGGAYESDAGRLKEQLASFFTSAEGPGELSKDATSSRQIQDLGGKVGVWRSQRATRGIVAPHIDLVRGGACFAWAYKEIGERCDADLFVILGTSHSASETPFILTMKDFQTPLGVMTTEKDFVRSLTEGYPGDLFKDELIHRFEHSIEFQVVFLQYVLGGRRDVRIVPILCSSFERFWLGNSDVALFLRKTPTSPPETLFGEAEGRHKMTEEDMVPSELPAIGDFISLLKKSISRSGRSVCLIAGADLSHVGRRFGDQVQLSQSLLELIKNRDMEMLQYAEQLDANGFFRTIQKDKDERKICGLPPIYTLLSVIDASRGKVLKYSQAPDSHTESIVSFASIVFS